MPARSAAVRPILYLSISSRRISPDACTVSYSLARRPMHCRRCSSVSKNSSSGPTRRTVTRSVQVIMVLPRLQLAGTKAVGLFGDRTPHRLRVVGLGLVDHQVPIDSARLA